MKAQAGFTAVEVLVTLAIAVLLVGGAYQAYSLVLGSSRDANARSTASNLAYQIMRKQIPALKAGSCTNRTINNNSEIPSGTLLTKPWSMQTQRTCPYGSSANVPKLITTTLTYGDEEVKHAVLVD